MVPAVPFRVYTSYEYSVESSRTHARDSFVRELDMHFFLAQERDNEQIIGIIDVHAQNTRTHQGSMYHMYMPQNRESGHGRDNVQLVLVYSLNMRRWVSLGSRVKIFAGFPRNGCNMKEIRPRKHPCLGQKQFQDSSKKARPYWCARVSTSGTQGMT